MGEYNEESVDHKIFPGHQSFFIVTGAADEPGGSGRNDDLDDFTFVQR